MQHEQGHGGRQGPPPPTPSPPLGTPTTSATAAASGPTAQNAVVVVHDCRRLTANYGGTTATGGRDHAQRRDAPDVLATLRQQQTAAKQTGNALPRLRTRRTGRRPFAIATAHSRHQVSASHNRGPVAGGCCGRSGGGSLGPSTHGNVSVTLVVLISDVARGRIGVAALAIDWKSAATATATAAATRVSGSPPPARIPQRLHRQGLDAQNIG